MIGRQETPEWLSRAVCAQVDPDLWFPEKGQSTKEAKRVCMSCPVRVECLNDALENNERFGVWGGKSDRDRERIRAGQRQVAA